MDEVALPGGVANAGGVVRVGNYVLRPANPYSQSVHALLGAVRDAGFMGAPVPVGIEGDRERLVFVEGDVAVPPYPDWAQDDAALASVADLLAAFHRAARSFDPAPWGWSPEMADLDGGTVVCHNDVCPENVVFRDGAAVAFLDFDFAAPGRPVYDLAQLARMWVPVDDDESARQLGWHDADRPVRLRLVGDTYGLSRRGRLELLGVFDDNIARGGAFLRRQVEQGHPAFVAMWHEIGGMARFDRRRDWWAEHRPRYVDALR